MTGPENHQPSLIMGSAGVAVLQATYTLVSTNLSHSTVCMYVFFAYYVI